MENLGFSNGVQIQAFGMGSCYHIFETNNLYKLVDCQLLGQKNQVSLDATLRDLTTLSDRSWRVMLL